MHTEHSPPSCQDISKSRPKLLASVRCVPQRDRAGKIWFRIELPDQRRFFRVGLAEYDLLNGLNGTQTIESARTAAVAATEASGQKTGLVEPPLTASQAESIVLWAHREGLLEESVSDSSGRTGRQKSSLMWIRIPLTRGGPKLDFLTTLMGWLFTPWAGACLIALWLLATACIIGDWDRFCRDAGYLFTEAGWIRLAVVWVGLKVIHEAGHAVCCRRFGGQVGQMGIAWMLVAPVAYVDLTDAYRIRSTARRAMTALAGVYLELSVAAIAALFWVNTESPNLAYWLSTVVLTAGVGAALFNLNPLMRLDGYFVLTDWLGRPNLAADASKTVQGAASWWFLGRGIQTRTSHGSVTLLLAYGVASLAYRISVISGLLITAVWMYGQVGVVLVTIALIGILVRPAWKIFRYVQTNLQRRPAAAVRLLFSGTLVIATIWGLIQMPWTAYFGVQTGWAAIAEYVHDSPVRNHTEGFVQEILVQDGQQVTQGTPIVRLENITLVGQRTAMENELKGAQALERQYRNLNQMGDEAAQKNKVAVIKSRLEALRTDETALIVRAPRTGQVLAPNLDHWMGRWLAEGESICYLVDPSQMKAIAAVPQGEIDSLPDLLGASVRIFCHAKKPVIGQISAVPQHASLQPPHPALAASAGGTLPTRPNTESESVQLVEPCLRIEITIENPPSFLKAGQPVRVVY